MELGANIEDRYIVEDFLGEGSAGKVYVCHDKILKSKFAVKILHSSASDKALARFHSEAKSTAKLNHLNIVKVFDFGQTKEGDAYLILEYCFGKDLDEFNGNSEGQSHLELLEIMHGITSGLDHAHKKGIIHRDIKPSNIILADQPDGRLIPKIVDFGVAKIQSQNLLLTNAKSAIGSPRYMSPEAIDGSNINQQSDIYSLGCLAYELFAKKLPYDDKSSIDTMTYKAKNDFPKLSSFVEIYIPPCIDELLEKCLARKTENRFQNTSEVLEKIELCMDIVNNAPELTESVNTDTEPIKKKKKIKVKTVLLTGIVLSIGLLLIGLLLPKKFPKSIESQPTNKILPYKAKDLFVKLDNKSINRFKINGQTWYRFTGINTARDLKPLLARKEIKRLRLAQDDLHGRDISILRQMNLIALDLVGSSLNKETIEEISKFDTLEELLLRKTKYVNDENVKVLINLKNLKKLDLSYSTITDSSISYLAKLKNLEEISFDGCKQFHGKGIGKLKNLKLLDLMNSGFQPNYLSNLIELKQLNILELSVLELQDKDVTPLKSLKKIKRLSLNENKKLTDESLSLLKKIASLKYLSLVGVPNISKQAEAVFRLERKDCNLKVLRKTPELQPDWVQ